MDDVDELHGRHRDVLELAVREAAGGWGFPSIREIGLEFGIGSTNGVNDHLKTLKRKGFIERDIGRGKARAWRLTNKARRLYGLPLLPLPIVGLRSAA